MTIDMGPFPANRVSFDPSDTFLIIPSDSHVVKVYVLVFSLLLTIILFSVYFVYLLFTSLTRPMQVQCAGEQIRDGSEGPRGCSECSGIRLAVLQ